MTAKEAVRQGSNYLVVGRPVLQSADKLKAVKSILAEIHG
jgi:orotidine-5'-phosphate decarboxylase